jgi:hypothetical protein
MVDSEAGAVSDDGAIAATQQKAHAIWKQAGQYKKWYQAAAFIELGDSSEEDIENDWSLLLSKTFLRNSKQDSFDLCYQAPIRMTVLAQAITWLITSTNSRLLSARKCQQLINEITMLAQPLAMKKLVQLANDSGNEFFRQSILGLLLQLSEKDTLQQIKTAHSLDLSNQSISDQTMNKLIVWRNLKSLDLSNSIISPPALELLPHLPALEQLDLTRTGMNDHIVILLAQLTELRLLNLSQNAISDAGVIFLKRLTKLEHLDLSATNVGNQATAILQKALPSCQILS